MPLEFAFNVCCYATDFRPGNLLTGGTVVVQRLGVLGKCGAGGNMECGSLTTAFGDSTYL